MPERAACVDKARKCGLRKGKAACVDKAEGDLRRWGSRVQVEGEGEERRGGRGIDEEGVSAGCSDIGVTSSDQSSR